MSPAEVIFQIVQLIVGGTDTTRVAITAEVALLLQHREQWEAVCRDPGLIPGAVDEAMRFEPSVASISRIAIEDIDVNGVLLPAGGFLTLSTMSAMRDENAYEQPDVFNIRRTISQGCIRSLAPGRIDASARRWRAPNWRSVWRC
jgi:hypothetical protein